MDSRACERRSLAERSLFGIGASDMAGKSLLCLGYFWPLVSSLSPG